MFNRITPVVKYLLIINVGLYFLGSFLRIDLNAFLSLRNLHSEYFMPFQFISYMFLHANTMHLISNMFGLFIFGPLLEQFWGPKRFLIFYMVTGIGAGVLYSGINYYETMRFEQAVEAYVQDPSPAEFKYILDKKANIDVSRHPDLNSKILDYAENPDSRDYIQWSINQLKSVSQLLSNSQMVGASGAIFGILLAFGMLFPNTVLMLLFPPIPIKAKYFVAIYGLFELFSGIHRASGDNVAHFAHLSGMLVAFILLKIWQKDKRRFY
ncbi:MAG: rhomboid family intramembrane serine protease [Cyclobacteriaceae bacterium]|nr:rhomboid family intramembrane serine protease [Cyclobacteriaceae bacterium]